MTDLPTLDPIDRGLVHALQIDGRASFTHIASVLATSPQTVTRRYQRLRATAGLRVVGLADPARAPAHQWIVRISAVPRHAVAVGHALARRPDTSWVRLTAGGTEIVAIVRPDPLSPADPHALLLHDLPRTAAITAVSAHLLLHLYHGGPTAWRGREGALTAAQAAQLAPPPPDDTAVEPDGADRVLLAALQHDGRASWDALAAACSLSAATVRRRVAKLRACGVLFFDVEVDDRLFGVTAQALIWLTVVPAHLDRVGTLLASHPEQAIVAATTGPTNLLANVLAPDPAALHHYLSRKLADDAITAVETAPVLRTLKAAGARAKNTPRGT